MSEVLRLVTRDIGPYYPRAERRLYILQTKIHALNLSDNIL